MENYRDKSSRKKIRKCIYNIINHPSQIAKYFTNFIQNRDIIIRPLDQIAERRYDEYSLEENAEENLGYFVGPRSILVNMNQSDLEIEKTIIHELQHFNYYQESDKEESNIYYDSDEDERLAQLSEMEYENKSMIPYSNFIQKHIKVRPIIPRKKPKELNILVILFFILFIYKFYFLVYSL